MTNFIQTVPLPTLDCDITTALRKEVRDLLSRSAGKDFFGAPALVVGQNVNFDDRETFGTLNGADALAYMAGYVQVWGNARFPRNVHPAVREVCERCLDFAPDEHLFTLLMGFVEDAVTLYMPHEGVELRVRIYIPEERLPDAIATIEQYKGIFYAVDGPPLPRE